MKNFDTLQYTKRAIAAGIPQQAAEFHAEEIAAVINDTLVTKDYLGQELTLLRTELKAEIASVRTELKAEIAGVRTDLLALENRLTWKFLGGMATILTLSQIIGHFFK